MNSLIFISPSLAKNAFNQLFLVSFEFNKNYVKKPDF